MTRGFRAAVVGATGYGGGEIIRRLLKHPHVELARVVSIDRVGEPIASAHPNLEGQTDLLFEDLEAEEAARGMDVVLFGLPHDVSARKIPEVVDRHPKIKVVDLSGAFRCQSSGDYERWYGVSHPCPVRLKEFVYGLPELNREAIRASGRVANPGCFATTIELGLLPLARRGWLRGRVETVAMTGSSGSGTAASAGTHHPVRSVNIKSYKTLAHPQQPEIVDTLRAAGADNPSLSFVPVSAPLSRGLFVSTFARIPHHLSEDEIRGAYLDDYRDEPFVRVPTSRLPEVAAVAGSNYAEVGVVMGEVDGDLRNLVCISALDNLIKGGAGQAVQNMNLVLGLDERLSLDDPGVLAVTSVVKLGGELLLPSRTSELESIIDGLRHLIALGEPLIITHGGGPQVTALMRARGIEPRLVAGRRVTDDAALDALLMAVGGEVNARLTSALLQGGIDAVGLNGLAHRCIRCVKQPAREVASAGGALIDYGFVGDVAWVDREFLGLFFARGMCPVLACIGVDESGRPLNINGDALASAVAVAVQARRLLLFTSAPGVLEDPDDPASRWTILPTGEARQAIADGKVVGGMIAKLEEAFAALEGGVGEVHVLGHVHPGDVVRALEEPGSVGTLLTGSAGS